MTERDLQEIRHYKQQILRVQREINCQGFDKAPNIDLLKKQLLNYAMYIRLIELGLLDDK